MFTVVVHTLIGKLFINLLRIAEMYTERERNFRKKFFFRSLDLVLHALRGMPFVKILYLPQFQIIRSQQGVSDWVSDD